MTASKGRLSHMLHPHYAITSEVCRKKKLFPPSVILFCLSLCYVDRLADIQSYTSYWNNQIDDGGKTVVKCSIDDQPKWRYDICRRGVTIPQSTDPPQTIAKWRCSVRFIYQKLYRRPTHRISYTIHSALLCKYVNMYMMIAVALSITYHILEMCI